MMLRPSYMMSPMNTPIMSNISTSTNVVNPARRGSTQTTPRVSPQRNSGTLPQDQQKQQQLFDMTSSEIGIKTGGFSSLSTVSRPPRRLMSSMIMSRTPAADTKATTQVREERSVPPLSPPPSSSSSLTSMAMMAASGHFLPLHDQPAFREDLLHRSVFVFGLQNVGECRELLQLLQAKCGPIAGAFRTVSQPLSDRAGVLGLSAVTSEGSSSVVICVAFNRVDSAVMAKRLDNTAQVYQKRFVVESATRFQYLLQRHPAVFASSSTSSSSSMMSMAGAPQHERLWQLLFSPIVGAVEIDWQAAGAAVGRGEVVLLTCAAFSTWGDDNLNGITNMNESNNCTNNNDSTYYSNMGFQHVTGIKGTTDGKRGGEFTRNFDMGTKGVTSQATATATSSAMSLSPPITTNSPAGIITDTLGRSNTLQQQYYNNRYESSVIPFFSSVARMASSLVSTVLSGTSGLSSMGGGRHEDAYLPAPLRQRVERASSRPFDVTPVSVLSTSPLGPTEGRGRGEGEFSEKRPRLDHRGEVTGAAYIPRRRTLGDYVIAALPFASHLLTPLFSADVDNAVPHDSSRTVVNRRNSNGDGKTGTSDYDVNVNNKDNTDNKNNNNNNSNMDGLRYGGMFEGHYSLQRKRRRSMDYNVRVYRDDGDERWLEEAGDGFTSIHPDVLSL